METSIAHTNPARRWSASPDAPVYLDCAATTPIDPRVQEELLQYLTVDFGNAGSRTHDFGLRARRAVERARQQVAEVVGATRGEVIFTSGATESNNLAILGLADHGPRAGKRHLVSTAIEHHAVLEPLRALEQRGFELTLVPPNPDGWVEPEAIGRALREDTLLVSVMQVNNETGVLQPIAEIADLLESHSAYFLVDAAQGFAKELFSLRHSRIDLISVSGHKFHAPKGIGALITRKRGATRPPLHPIMHGGGQELGLRPGTLPVHLIAALGKAGEIALAECEERASFCREFRRRFLKGLEPLRVRVNGDPSRSVPHILNLSIPGFDAESVMEAWRDIAAVSNGAACTSQSYTCSHVLAAMRLAPERRDGAVRISWCHMSQMPDVGKMVRAIESLHS